MMRDNSIKILGTIFLVVLMFSLVSAETNTSVMYGENASGALVPLQTTDDGTLKVEMDFMNITAGDISASGNLSIGERITFSLGEMIDNIVDDWIRITGSVNITGGNLTLGGKTLSNNNGSLYWGDFDLKNNVSVNYGQNSSGAVLPYRLSGEGILQMDIVDEIWEKVSGVTQLVSSGDVFIDGNLIATSNGVGINSKISRDVGYNVTSTDRNRIIALNSSAVNDTTFMLPSVSASDDGVVYRFLNDAEYRLRIKPSDSSAVWNSGSGYGIDLPDRGTMVQLRYDAGGNKWDILQKTGGKVLIEGLVLMEPMDTISTKNFGSRFNTLDKSGRNMAEIYDNLFILNSPNIGKFNNWAWNFDGAGDYATYVDSTDWDIFGTNESGHKTVAFWVYFDSLGVVDRLITHYQNGSNIWQLYKHVDNNLYFYSIGNTPALNFIGGSVSATAWHHVVLVINGSNVGLYIDGNQVAYQTGWGVLDLAGSFFVGWDADVNFLDGLMQDLHISYNNPYNANPNSGSTDSFTVPNAPFVGVME